jgi:hypothetical protein
MPVSDRDREVMRRIGAAKAASHAEAAAEHRALSLGDRLRRSWALYVTRRDSGSVERRDDDPTQFYTRARELGMYQP